jgi:ribosome-binding factor A
LRIGEEIRHVLADLLGRDALHDPQLAGVSLTVSEVRVSPDLKNATAFVLPLGGGKAEEIVAALRRAAPALRGPIARSMRLRYAPRLDFVLDRSFDTAQRMESLLRQPEVARDLGSGPEDEDGA